MKLINALSSKANLSFKTTNLDPDNLMEVSKSIPLNLDPRSICDIGLNKNFLIVPIFSINLFDFSSLPIGTSSKAIFGKMCNKSLIFF